MADGDGVLVKVNGIPFQTDIQVAREQAGYTQDTLSESLALSPITADNLCRKPFRFAVYIGSRFSKAANPAV